MLAYRGGEPRTRDSSRNCPGPFEGPLPGAPQSAAPAHMCAPFLSPAGQIGAEIAGGYASPYGHQHAANNKYLARSNKSRMRAEATKPVKRMQ